MFSIFGQSPFAQFFSWLICTAIVAIPVFFALFKFFGKKWLENRFSKDLEAFKAQTLHEYSFLLTYKTKFLEKEYDVLSDLWRKLSDAYNKLDLSLAGAPPPTEVFQNYDEEDLQEFCAKMKFNHFEKKYFFQNDNKKNAVFRIIQDRENLETGKSIKNYKKSFEENRIFISPDIKQKFLNLDKNIEKPWSLKVMGNSNEAEETKNKIKNLMDDIENILQEKFFPNKESKKTVLANR